MKVPPQHSLRVLHLLNGEFMSGVEQVVITLAGHHQRARPYILCLRDGKMSERYTGTVPLDVIPMRSRFDWSAPFRLASHIKRQRIDLVNTHTLRANLVGVLAGRITGVPVITTIHSPSARETTHKFKNRLNNLIERSLVPWTSFYITVSQSLCSEMKHLGVPPDRRAAVQNGVDLRRLDSEDGCRFREELGLPLEQPLVGMIALLRPRKGTEVFLRAIKIIAEKMPGARFVVVGDPIDDDYGNTLRELSSTLGIDKIVHFTPFRSDIGAVLDAIDILALPSLFGEGLPLVALEAMAAFRPVVATAISGMEEIVLDGVTGITVPPDNHQAFAAALLELLLNTDKRELLGAGGRKLVEDRFSAAQMTSQAEEIYHEVLRREHHG